MRRFRPNYTNTFATEEQPVSAKLLSPYRDAWPLLNLVVKAKAVAPEKHLVASLFNADLHQCNNAVTDRTRASLYLGNCNGALGP